MAGKNMWLNEHHAIVDFTDTALPPSKDFYHVFVTTEKFILIVWKIVPPTRADSHNPPQRYESKYEEFPQDDRWHSEIVRLAGEPTLRYLLEIQKGHLDYICRIKPEVQMKIILNLDLQDLYRLRRVNRYFKEMCDSCHLWEKIYCMCSETPITPELRMLADDKGWKKLFFTNKLQLQMQLRRMKQHEDMEVQQEQISQSPAFITSD